MKFFFDLFPSIGLARIALVLSIMPAAYLGGRLIELLVQRYLIARKWIPSSFSAKRHFSKSWFVTLLLLGLSIAVPLMRLQKVTAGRISLVLQIALVLSCVWTLGRIVKLVKISLYSRLDVARPDNLRQRKIRTQVQFIEKMILIFLNVIAGALILMNFEGARKIGSSLIASAGLAGVIIGFAAQKSLTNLIAGFQIAFTQPIRIDDVVIVEGEWGKIEEITFTYVVIRLWDKRTLVVPITYFLEKPFQNWTRASADLLGTILIYVDFRMPMDPLRAEFHRILKDCALWDGRVAAVQVTDVRPSEMEIRFLVGARNASDAFDLRCTVREKLIYFIQSQYPECFPQKRVAATNTPAAIQEPYRYAEHAG